MKNLVLLYRKKVFLLKMIIELEKLLAKTKLFLNQNKKHCFQVDTCLQTVFFVHLMGTYTRKIS